VYVSSLLFSKLPPSHLIGFFPPLPSLLSEAEQVTNKETRLSSLLLYVRALVKAGIADYSYRLRTLQRYGFLL
jgi:hypothetical protein